MIERFILCNLYMYKQTVQNVISMFIKDEYFEVRDIFTVCGHLGCHFGISGQ